MGVMGLLKFALKVLDIIAWPLLALVYPLCASIRAIETNSNSDSQKLVTYWISFSLVSLFEYFFTSVLEWIQFWPYIKLMIICCLALPYFEGASYIYNHCIQPYIFVSPQVVIDEFNKRMAVVCERNDFLAEAERYIKDNGPEALEKLIANECKIKKPNIDVEEIKAVSAIEKKEVEWSHSKEPGIVQKDEKAVEAAEKKEAPMTKGTDVAEPDPVQIDNRTLDTKEIKETAAVVDAAREVKDIPVSEKVQKQWTCTACELIMVSEKNFHMHLQGKRHKAACEALKARDKEIKERRRIRKNAKEAAVDVKNSTLNEAACEALKARDKENKERLKIQKNAKEEAVDVKNLTFRCDLCNVNCTGKSDLASHLRGKKHLGLAVNGSAAVGGWV